MPEKSEMDCVTLTFTWFQEVPQYGDKLLQRLNGFRQKNMFYDVTLKATDEDLAAHKVVLAACGGMFRSHFIDRQTKKILSHVEEVHFDCPSSGLRCILKFAYSGVLEISEANLLATFQAAQATQMKEVEQICVDLALSRLDWILKFDGNENTIPTLTSDGKLSKCEQDAHKLSVDDTFELLHKLIKLNASSLYSKDNAIDCDPDADEFPCLSEVDKRWPDLKPVYVTMVRCLRQVRKVKYPEGEPSPNNGKSQVPASGDSKSPDLPTNNDSVAPLVEKKEDLPLHDTDTSHVPCTEKDKNEKNGSPTKSGLASPVEKESNAKSSNGGNVTKPATKPRKSSVTQHTRSLSSGTQHAQVASVVTQHSRNLSGGKLDFSTSSDEASKPSAAKTPHKPRKKPAPKPPGPPPGSSKVSSQTKSTPPPPSETAKHPPPRPKPPSVKRTAETKAEASEPADYDDSLNPFADDDEMTESTHDYDDSLNPFG